MCSFAACTAFVAAHTAIWLLTLSCSSGLSCPLLHMCGFLTFSLFYLVCHVCPSFATYIHLVLLICVVFTFLHSLCMLCVSSFLIIFSLSSHIAAALVVLCLDSLCPISSSSIGRLCVCAVVLCTHYSMCCAFAAAGLVYFSLVSPTRIFPKRPFSLLRQRWKAQIILRRPRLLQHVRPQPL